MANKNVCATNLAPQFPSSWFAAAAIFGLMSLAVLAKGPVGFVLPTAIIALSLWLGRCVSLEKLSDGTHLDLRLRLSAPLRHLASLFWEMKPLTAVVMLLLIAAPWYAWVGWRTNGEFLAGFLWDHNLRRATESMEGHSGPAILFYPATLLMGFFPASIFLIPSLLESRRLLTSGSARQAAAIVFCLTWILVVVGIFSLAQTKLPSYVTPCYPALAVLVGNLLERWTANKLAISSQWLRWSLAANVLVGMVIVGGLYAAVRRYLPGEESIALIGVVLIVGGAAALGCELWLRSRQRAAAISVASGLLFSLLLFGLGPAAADRHQQSHILLASLREQEPAEIAAWHCLEPSWVFYLGRPIREVEKWGDAAVFMQSRNHLLIVRDEEYNILAGRLPADVQIVGRSQRFLKDETLLILGRRVAAARRPRTGDLK